jgi:hypothetical protein
MPTMTAKQPFRDRKSNDEKTIAAESKSTPLVIQLTRKFSAIPYFDAADPERSEKNIKRDEQEDLNLPLFPGESWFGG